jgi:hypothetical protein
MAQPTIRIHIHIGMAADGAVAGVIGMVAGVGVEDGAVAGGEAGTAEGGMVEVGMAAAGMAAAGTVNPLRCST